MSEERNQYSSTILVSKSPNEAADIVRTRIDSASQLNSEFIRWFSDYTNFTNEYNSKLKGLLKVGSEINSRVGGGGELGHLAPLWNSVLNTVNTEINCNDLLARNIRKDSVNQFKEFVERDVRWSELLSDSRELSDIAHELNKKRQTQAQDSEYKWNSKAPQIFETFETVDYLRINIIKDSFLKFESNLSDKFSNLIKVSESSTATILDFEPQTELVRFSEVAASTPSMGSSKSKGKLASSGGQAAPHIHHSSMPLIGRSRVSSHATVQSEAGSTVNSEFDTDKKDRKKLRSRVGSIFGRNKNKKKGVSTLPVVNDSNSSINRSTDSFSRVQTGASSSYERREPVVATTNDRPSPNVPNVERFDNSSDDEIYSQPATQSAPLSRAPLNAQPQLSLQSQPLQPLQPSSNNTNSPFGSNAIASSADTDALAYQLSSAASISSNDHRAAPPPPPSRKGTHQETNGRTRNLGAFDETIEEDSVATYDTNKPLPQVHNEGTARRPRKEIQSQLFTNLPQARDSVFIARPPTLPANDTQSLVSQNTGNTLSAGNLFKHSEMTSPGLSASVAEVVNAIFKDGQLVKSQTMGEIAFQYKNDSFADIINIRIPTGNWEKSILNDQLIHQVAADQYQINTEIINMRPLGGIKYALVEPVVPVTIQQIWRFEAHQASLMISLKLSPELVEQRKSITLTNVTLSVAVKDVEATSASSRPQGSFNKEKSRVTWRYTAPISFTPSHTEEKLIARFMTNGIAKEHDSGIQLQFSTVEDTSNFVISNLDDGTVVPSVKTLVTGSYSGHFSS